MAKPKKDKNILGYVFGFKGSKDTSKPNSFCITFTHGISDNYPKEYEKKKDFWCQEVRVGDYSELYANDQLVKESFEEHVRNDIEGDGREFYVNLFENERIGYFQDTDIDLEKYLILQAVAGMHCDFSFSHQFVTDDQINQLLASYGLNTEIYHRYQDISEQIYNDEIASFAHGMGH